MKNRIPGDRFLEKEGKKQCVEKVTIDEFDIRTNRLDHLDNEDCL